MNKLFTLAAILLISITAAAQSGSEGITKKQLKKQLEAVQDSIAHANAIAALNNADFVANADFLILKRGRAVVVSPTTNFVSLSGDKAVVQITPYNSSPGLNGIGGITLEGRATKTETRTDKKGNTFFTMDVLGSGISTMVEISLNKASNRTSVTIYANTTGDRITLRGYLVPTEQADTYKATPLF